LEFLVEETASWEVAATVRSPYMERLQRLRDQILRREPLRPEPIPEPALKKVEAPLAPTPPKEQVPFDQWLLSERNIKLALYAGGALLVIAGIIFIGVNWTRIVGPVKFAITLMVTGLMYLGGYLLFNRPAYRIGGIALLGVASGFLTLNFGVLQLYVMGPAGLRDDVMWLIASPICLLIYMLTTYWTQSKLFTYISLTALASVMLAALQVASAPSLVILFSFSLLTFGILLLARALENSKFADYTLQPLTLVSQFGQPVAIMIGLASWGSTEAVGAARMGSPWLSILTVGVGVPFYVMSERIYRRIEARWAAAFLLPIAVALALSELNLSDTFIVTSMMVLSLGYMGIGSFLERREGRRAGGWPLYAAAYVVALVVTLMAAEETRDVVWILMGDVGILALSAIIHKDDRWMYGATWLFMLPIYLLIDLNVPELHNQGLLMGLLGLNYAGVGYVLGRPNLRLGGSFLTAAAFLSLVTVGLTWGSPGIASIVLAIVVVLYLMAALWLEWTWLLLPALMALNLLIFSLNQLLIDAGALQESLIISTTILGTLLVLITLPLQRSGQEQWEWPLLLVGAFNLSVAYLAGLAIGGSLAIGQSLLLGVLLLNFAWLRESDFIRMKLPPLLSYLGIITIFVGHFYLLDSLGLEVDDEWMIYTAGLCGTFVALAWFLDRQPLKKIYAAPLRNLGLSLMLIPLIGATVLTFSLPAPLLGAVTFAIAGLALSADAARRGSVYQAYLGGFSFVAVIWAILLALEVVEPQAYVAPLGIALLGIGWNERRREKTGNYRLSTSLGLIILLGSSFLQSLPQEGILYAVLLGLESVAVLVWAIYKRTRAYVRPAIFAFLANGVVQLGPAFVEMPRWIQIGLTGGTLFGGGLLALFKREELIRTRTKLSEGWKEWGA
jgi:hypothetical protein